MSQSSQSPDPNHDLSGRQLGEFRLLRRLGRGATADVYLAQQQSLQRQVAVKILRPELATDRTYVERFLREAQAAAGLIHANIVQIYEVGQVGSLHYIAQEYVLGQNLRQWLRRGVPPDLRQALTIMRQVAAALAKAAEQGIVHRDIKPENILLARSGEVKVADFGLARLVDPSQRVDLTQTGITLGTPLYMSPEQIEGRPLDPRSDLYSLGVTCYQMLAGQPPFSSETPLGLAMQHVKKAPEPLELLRPDLPPALCRIIHKLLAKRPEDRYASARDLVRDLVRLHAEVLGDPWSTGDLEPSSDGFELPTLQNATTQRLDRLMRTVAGATGQGRRWRGWAASWLLALVAGAGVAWWAAAPPRLLAVPPDQRPPVPDEQTALGQWFFASNVDTEEALRSVIASATSHPYLQYRAKQQLACICLQKGNDAEAMGLFKELAGLGPTESTFRAFGLAGQCSVQTMRRDYPAATATLAKLWPIRAELKDPQMRQLLQHTLAKIRAQAGETKTQQWQDWLDEQFPSPR